MVIPFFWASDKKQNNIYLCTVCLSINEESQSFYWFVYHLINRIQPKLLYYNITFNYRMYCELCTKIINDYILVDHWRQTFVLNIKTKVLIHVQTTIQQNSQNGKNDDGYECNVGL